MKILVYGDSLLVVSDDEIVKFISMQSIRDAMNYGQRYGSLIKIKVENMREQHTALLDEPAMMLNQLASLKRNNRTVL